MPSWSLVAAGHIPDTSPHTPAQLQQQLRDVLADPRWHVKLSELRVDGDKPLRVTLHTE